MTPIFSNGDGPEPRASSPSTSVPGALRPGDLCTRLCATRLVSMLPSVTPQLAVHFHSHIVHPPIYDTPVPMPRHLVPHVPTADLASLGLYPRYPSPHSSAPMPPFWFSRIPAAPDTYPCPHQSLSVSVSTMPTSHARPTGRPGHTQFPSDQAG